MCEKKVYESDVFALCQNCCYNILFISDCLKIFSHEKKLMSNAIKDDEKDLAVYTSRLSRG